MKKFPQKQNLPLKYKLNIFPTHICLKLKRMPPKYKYLPQKYSELLR